MRRKVADLGLLLVDVRAVQRHAARRALRLHDGAPVPVLLWLLLSSGCPLAIRWLAGCWRANDRERRVQPERAGRTARVQPESEPERSRGGHAAAAAAPARVSCPRLAFYYEPS